MKQPETVRGLIAYFRRALRTLLYFQRVRGSK